MQCSTMNSRKNVHILKATADKRPEKHDRIIFILPHNALPISADLNQLITYEPINPNGKIHKKLSKKSDVLRP